MTKFHVSGIRIGDNPIGGGAARCEKRLFLLKKSKNGKKKKTPFFEPKIIFFSPFLAFFSKNSIFSHLSAPPPIGLSPILIP